VYDGKDLWKRCLSTVAELEKWRTVLMMDGENQENENDELTRLK